MNEQDKIARLRLIRSENVGSVTFRTLLEHFGSATEALNRLPDFAKRGGRGRPLKICSEADARREWENLEHLGGKFVFAGEKAYPPLLAEIPDAPPVLSVLGNTDFLQGRYVAVVGTRNASVNGRNIARRMSMDLVKEGFGIVSGLALGIDGAAHEGALFAATDKTSTIAVLGTGIDVIYPEQHRGLYDRIREKGVLISEFPFGTKPQPSKFPQRNRIISGICTGLVVIEATLRSGSLITANRALEQGKDVFAVPASPLDPRAAGGNRLIKTGAPLVESAADIVEHLTALPLLSLHETAKENKKTDVSVPSSDYSSTEESRRVLNNRLDATPVAIDTLIRETGLPAQTISVLLIELELAGQIERLPGNKVVRILSL